MTVPEEFDYIGLSEPLSLENRGSEKLLLPSSSSENEINNGVNLKETELRLGLPGSESPERTPAVEVSLFGKDLKDEGTNGSSHGGLKNFVSGSKRGFSDAINGSGKWGLSMNGGSDVDLGKSSSTLQSCLPGNSVEGSNVSSVQPCEEKKKENGSGTPASKAQVVGWPPIRSFRKNTLTTNLSKNSDVAGKSGSGCLYLKVSMDGAPYLRKIDLKTYCSYPELSSALEQMFSCFTIGQYGHGLAGQSHLSESHLMDLLHGSEYVLTYEDKDGDWMLVGDVPWEMFTGSCKRLRIMKGSDAIGLAPSVVRKCKNQN